MINEKFTSILRKFFKRVYEKLRSIKVAEPSSKLVCVERLDYMGVVGSFAAHGGKFPLFKMQPCLLAVFIIKLSALVKVTANHTIFVLFIAV